MSNHLMLKLRRFSLARVSLVGMGVISASMVGCSWVRPAIESHYVSLVKPELVQSCEKLGLTTSKSVSKIVVVPRSEAKIMNELIILAKNQAVVMKGDTIAVDGPFKDGQQTFGIYRCSAR